MAKKTLALLEELGLDRSCLARISSGEVDWDISENDLLLIDREGGTRHIARLTDSEIEELFRASEFETRSLKASSCSTLFPLGSIDDWAGVAPKSNWEHIVKAYAKSVTILGQSMHPTMDEPYLFLVRHTLEIWLKAIIMLGQEGLGLTQDLPDHHDLQRLWTSAFPIIQLKGHLKGDEIGRLQAMVIEYHELDPKSFSFRYPVTKKNETIQHNPRIHAFSIKQHNDRFADVEAIMSHLIKVLKIGLIWTRAMRTRAQQGGGEERR